MEFKGTKELQVDLKHNQVLNSSRVLVIANINDYNGEGKYNTLLYSKAPEMLKELMKEVEILKSMGLGDTERCKRKEQLIKEATEL